MRTYRQQDPGIHPHAQVLRGECGVQFVCELHCLWNFYLLSRSGGSPSGEANPFFADRGFQTQAGWLPLLARRRLAFPASYDLWLPAWGKSRFLEIFAQGLFPRPWVGKIS